MQNLVIKDFLNKGAVVVVANATNKLLCFLRAFLYPDIEARACLIIIKESRNRSMFQQRISDGSIASFDTNRKIEAIAKE